MIVIDPAAITAVVSVITVLLLIAGGVFWLGKLTNRVGNLEHRVDQLDKKIDQLAIDLRAGMRDLRTELLEEMRTQRTELLEEMRTQRAELLEEMRRGNQQLLIALANHGHDDGGQPVFRVPVGAE